MVEREEQQRDLASLVVASVGSVVETGEIWEPWRLLDPMGVRVEPVAAFLADLQAMGRPATTQRSYSLALLRWFRFLWVVEVGWDRVSRDEARDFCRWMQVTDKPVGVHWRHRDPGSPPAVPPVSVRKRSATPNPVTGKATTGPKYAPATSLHAETVLRGFYGFHRDMGSGPMLNPFPLARDRSVGRAHGHHNPLEPFRKERAGLYRPKVTSRVPRHIPDERFNELFAGLGSHRDRALIAFYVSTGARASELLGATGGDVDPGQQLITVIRKGSRALQPLPASPDSFVWLRLYQAQLHGLVPAGRDQGLWWTSRRPFRPLTYHAAHRMFGRVNAALGTNWTLHDLRHTAAYRMAADPAMSLVDVAWALGHAHLTTTQLYLNPVPHEVIAAVLAYHARRGNGPGPAPAGDVGTGLVYRPETLNVLFGEHR
jgi:integrase